MVGHYESELHPKSGRCLVLQPSIKAHGYTVLNPSYVSQDSDSRIEEAIGFARAIELNVVYDEIININYPKPSSLFGAGVVARFIGVINYYKIQVVLVDANLTPVQQRNLEKEWNVKVIDRTGIILEIFGARARTKEGRLQVELASLSYQRSRLVRSWTHLERQRGGFGFMGGPGERQIESDRRMIDGRITTLKKQLKNVRRTRGLHRHARQSVPYPIVALVGYTNAGKSTLFNILSKSNVLTKDQLFATLDPTMRMLQLFSGMEVIISDTVGFVSDLPHELVESFRATLEEVMEADLLIHVRDISHRDTIAQKRGVEEVLLKLGAMDKNEVGNSKSVPIIEVLNKCDLLSPEDLENHLSQLGRHHDRVMVSAKTGKGTNELLKLIKIELTKQRKEVKLEIKWEEGALLAWLYERGDVIARRDTEDCIELSIRLEPNDIARLDRGKATIRSDPRI